MIPTNEIPKVTTQKKNRKNPILLNKCKIERTKINTKKEILVFNILIILFIVFVIVFI